MIVDTTVLMTLDNDIGLQFLYEPAGLRQGDYGVGVRPAHRQRRPAPVRAQERVAVALSVLPPFPGSFRSIPTSEARLIQRSTV